MMKQAILRILLIESSTLYDRVVTVLVGPEQKIFHVHRGLICHYSTYFRGAWKGEFREAHEEVVKLENDEVKVFEVFFSWLYTHRFFEENGAPTNWAIGRMTLAKVWIFGDARGIPELQNAIIDEMITCIAKWERLNAQFVKEVYDNTVDGAPLRKFSVEYFLSNDDKGLLTLLGSEGPDYPSQFYREVALGLVGDRRRIKSQVQWGEIDKKDYHVQLDKAGVSQD